MKGPHDDVRIDKYDGGDALSRGDSVDHLDVDDVELDNVAGESDVSGQDERETDSNEDEDDGPDFVPSHDAGAFTSISLSEAILNDFKTSHTVSECRGDKKTQGKSTGCCMCGARALYTCPGCGRRTCSMACVQVHKQDFNCTGERDVAAKIPLSEFTDEQLERDFHFLENCRRVIDNVERSFPRSMWRFTYKALPPPLHALREAARRRGVICQITSEGMHRREVNTSRLDRKTNTIVWRCEFQFIDARHPDEPTTIGTNWGSERHRLGDIMKYCWATNPPLLCYHINRQYNRASKYVSGSHVAKKATAKAEEGAEQSGGTGAVEDVKELNAPSPTLASNSHDDGGEEPTTEDVVASSLCAKTATPETSATTAETQDTDSSPVDAVRAPDEAAEESVNLISSNTNHPPTPELVPLRTYEEAPPMPPIEPISPKERAQQAYVHSFLEHERYVILSRAERLGNELKYFQLHPHETLNENLRLLFFVNEFPFFQVVHVSLLERFPLVTDEDKEKIRGSFRSKKTHEVRGERAPLRKRSDMEPEELERLAKVPCRRFLHGRCQLREECPYWHCTPEEIPVCRSFLHTGQCDKGARCSFRHDPEAVRLAQRRQREDGGRGMGRGSMGRGSGARRGGFPGPRWPRRRVE